MRYLLLIWCDFLLADSVKWGQPCKLTAQLLSIRKPGPGVLAREKSANPFASSRAPGSTPVQGGTTPTALTVTKITAVPYSGPVAVTLTKTRNATLFTIASLYVTKSIKSS